MTLIIKRALRFVLLAPLLAASGCNDGGGLDGIPSPLDVRKIDGTYGWRFQNGPNFGVGLSGAGDVNADGFADVLVGMPHDFAFLMLGGPSIRSRSISLTAELSSRGLGRSVANAGDLNGDRISDILIGAPSSDKGGLNSGLAIVVFGGDWLDDQDRVDLDAVDPTRAMQLVASEPDAFAGTSVSGAGDVNGDGSADVLIGSSRFRDSEAGAADAYLVFGAPHIGEDGDFALASLDGVTGVRLRGVSGSECRAEVSGIGDVNGDGRDDVIVRDGSKDIAYAVFGASSLGAGGVLDLGSLAQGQGVVLVGSGGGDGAGESVADAGDVNGDGFVDIAVGASRADPGGRQDAGTMYLVFGVYGIESPFVTLDHLDGSNGIRIEGARPGDQMGYRIAGAGDLNGDGFADVLGCALGASVTYLVYGGSDLAPLGELDLGSLTRRQGVRFEGYVESYLGDLPATKEENPSRNVSALGDVDGDGGHDLAVSGSGVFEFDFDPSPFGVVYVVVGRPRSE